MCYWKLQSSVFYEAYLGLRKQELFIKSNHFFFLNIDQFYIKQWIKGTLDRRASTYFRRLVKCCLYIWSELAIYQITLSGTCRLSACFGGTGLAVSQTAHRTLGIFHNLWDSAFSSVEWGYHHLSHGQPRRVSGGKSRVSGGSAHMGRFTVMGRLPSLPSPTQDTQRFWQWIVKAHLCLAFADKKEHPMEMSQGMKITNVEALLVAKPRT